SGQPHFLIVDKGCGVWGAAAHFSPLTCLPTCWKFTCPLRHVNRGGRKSGIATSFFTVAPEIPPVYMTPLSWLAKGSFRKICRFSLALHKDCLLLQENNLLTVTAVSYIIRFEVKFL